ncbi:GGDEF domain-containing protein [Methylophaga sp. OBS3]|uniref:GGDEF domain-containing protein n=1 Tax=Methylophaga sp. OBS3 TaxID=2991934 RepID=UPI0022585A51|nr:GGDEF domain-containing protein [Methylophaga sp. OBS3]MCX4189550.1 GGDEF domain-containing protein [Methylophaga sp. OBS3]
MRQTVTTRPSNLRLFANTVPAITERQAGRESLLLRLPMLLQTTLDIRQLLQLFHQQVQSVLQHDGLRLQFSPLRQDIRLGKTAHHKCHYELEIDKQSLGKLTLSRGIRFSDEDIQLIEDLLCKLVYPLRNCQQYQQALDAAMTDKLTGMPNREAFDRHIDREVELAKRLNLPLSLLVVDIDNFKNINDAYGHSSGDRALTLTGQTLINCLRRSDIAFRYGGEEFTVVLSHTDGNTASQVAERLLQAISLVTCHDGSRSFSLTVSIGIATMKQDENCHQLFERADKALYQAKQTGRNRAVQADQYVN